MTLGNSTQWRVYFNGLLNRTAIAPHVRPCVRAPLRARSDASSNQIASLVRADARPQRAALTQKSLPRLQPPCAVRVCRGGIHKDEYATCGSSSAGKSALIQRLACS